MKQRLAVFFIVLVLLAGVFSIAEAQRGRRGGHGGHGMGMESFGMMHKLAKLEARLNLTPEQSQQIRQIVEQRRQQFRQQMQQQGGVKEHAALARQIFSDNPNQQAIQQQVTTMQQRHAQMMEQMVQAALEVNKVLTPEQRAEAQKIIAEHEQAAGKMRERMQERRQQQQP